MMCRKCSGPGALVIRKEYCYCNECFITSINHKFRACIGKNKTLSYNEKVLIYLSGDASSTVLLDLIHFGMSLNNHKKMRITPYFLNIKENDEISNLLVEQCKNYNFNLTVVSIDEYCHKGFLCNDDAMIKHTSENILSNIPSSISEDVMMKIKQNIFIKVAKDLQCKMVFTAETTTLLAAQLLSNIAIGRGSQVENDIGFVDKRDENIKIIRPMRDISNEEIEQYIRVKDLKPANCNMWDNLNGTSLQSIIRGFVLDLQENYPATVSTICKTADKMGSTTNNNNRKCTICQSNLNSNNAKLTAVDATIFSRQISSRITNCNESLQHIEGGDNLMFPLIYEKLCYCCSRNISQLNDPMISL